MENSLTDKNYFTISDDVYDIETGKLNEGGTTKNNKFKILAVENNKNNGMQAMAVAPVDSNGGIDIKQIEILKLNKQIKRV